MKLIGLTGGIGMGKSTAASLLEQRGVPTVDTDLLARRVVEPGQPALLEIRQTFGDGVIGPDGRLLRDRLARLVFADDSKRQALEAITHPHIRELWRAQAVQWRAEQRPVAAVVIPLLFETGAQAEFEAIVCVACSPATQRRRLLGRGWSEDEIRLRNAAQWPIEQKMAQAHFVVWTEADLAATEAQLDLILRRLS